MAKKIMLNYLQLRQIFSLLFIKPFFRLFFNFKALKKENVKNIKRPLIIISNHKNILDSFAIAAAIPISSGLYPIRIMGEVRQFKSNFLNLLINLKIISFVYWYFGVFPAIRKVGLQKSLKIPKKILNKKGVVLLYPEGKVIKGYDIGSFKRGAAALSSETSAPILPIALRIIKKKKKIRPFYLINFGSPLLLPQNVSYEKGSEMLRRIIIKLYQEIS
jgi:1-acyl-sn-glycerol-3-phosphate acyltransferase